MQSTHTARHWILWPTVVTGAFAVWGAIHWDDFYAAQILMVFAAVAGGAFLLMALSRRGANPAVRPAARVASAIVILELLLSILMIGSFRPHYRGQMPVIDESGDLLSLMLAIAGTGAAATLCVRALAFPRTGFAAAAGLALSILVMAFWFVGLEPGYPSNHIWEIGDELAVMGVIAVFALVGRGYDSHHWRWAGVVAAVIALAMLSYQSIAGDPSLEPVGYVITLAILIAYANLILHGPRANRWLPLICLALAIVTAVFANLVLIDLDRNHATVFANSARGAAASGVLWGIATLTLISGKMRPRREFNPTSIASAPISRSEPSGVEFRTYQAIDCEEVVALWQSVFPGAATRDQLINDIKRKVAMQPDLFLVAIVDSKLIACAMAGDDGYCGWVYGLAVDQAHRRLGIATAMLRRVEAALLQRGCVRLHISASPHSFSATSLGRSLGYVFESRIDMYRMLA